MVIELSEEFGITRKTGHKWLSDGDVLKRHGMVNERRRRGE